MAAPPPQPPAPPPPEPEPRPHRVVEYLESAKNIAGCVLALGGLVLYFTGVIGDAWPFVVGALYAAGALLAPARPALSLLPGGFDLGGVRASLDDLEHEIHGRLPEDRQARVDAIRTTILGILPKAGNLTPGSQELFILQRTATDYLPTTINTFLELPTDYADTKVVEGGKSPRALVAGQLDLLSQQMNELADAVNRNDVDRLLAQGRFLE